MVNPAPDKQIGSSPNHGLWIIHCVVSQGGAVANNMFIRIDRPLIYPSKLKGVVNVCSAILLRLTYILP